MSYECEVINQPSQPALSIRSRTSIAKIPETFDRCFPTLGQYLAELGEQLAGAPFAVYYNMDMEDLDVEIGFPVWKELPGKGEIKSSEIPEGKFASCIHTGPYTELGLAYQALTSWTEQNGYLPTGVAYEFYLNSPQEASPQELQTKILFPLKQT